jgi:cytoskeleton protein RodZ
MPKTLRSPFDLSQLSRDPDPAPSFEVRGRPGIHIVVSAVAGVTALAYLWRAVDGGSVILWAMVALLVGIAVLHLLGRREASLPRLVADEHGVRVRRRRQWIGLPWDDIDRVEVASMHGPLGSTVVRLLRDDDEPIEVGCGTTTRTSADDIVVALRDLADSRTSICRGVAPSDRSLPSDEPEAPDDEAHDEADDEPEARADEADADNDKAAADETSGDNADGKADDKPGAQAETPAEDTGSRRAVRAEVTRTESGLVGKIPDGDGAKPLSLDDREHDTADIEPITDEIAEEPAVGRAPTIQADSGTSIGPLLSAARFRARLSVDELGERTRIRPHVIESIENDDFGPCGGDFYARGHLRSLCRVLGVEPAPILETFDRRYAHAPIEAREVFEAELATGPRPTFRSIGRGANWVALVVAVLLLAIVWTVVKVVAGDSESGSGAQEEQQSSVSEAPAQGDNERLTSLGGPSMNELTLRGVGDGTRVEVKNSDRNAVWRGRLQGGESQDLTIAGPITVIAKDGGAVRIRLNGDSKGRIGESGERSRVTVGRR